MFLFYVRSSSSVTPPTVDWFTQWDGLSVSGTDQSITVNVQQDVERAPPPDSTLFGWSSLSSSVDQSITVNVQQDVERAPPPDSTLFGWSSLSSSVDQSITVDVIEIQPD
jgi:hypothetical protein